MIDADKRRAVFLLHKEGMGRNQIARQLRMSPNTVRAIIEQKGEMPLSTRSDKIQIDAELLKRLYSECDGYAQRVHEKLVEEEHIQVQYSTLTRMLRQLGVSRSREERCERVADQPGAEMQHDTTSYSVRFGPDAGQGDCEPVVLALLEAALLEVLSRVQSIPDEVLSARGTDVLGPRRTGLHHRQHEPGATERDGQARHHGAGDGSLCQPVWIPLHLP